MFSTHILNDAGKEAVKNFKSLMSHTVHKVLDSMPDGRDKSIFITKIEEAMFFGTRALASSPKNHSDMIEY